MFPYNYVYKLKRNVKTDTDYHFKVRLIVRGFEMVKCYEDNFSPTPGISIVRLMVSIDIANDLELHSVLDDDDRSVVYEVLKNLCMATRHRHELYTKPWMLI